MPFRTLGELTPLPDGVKASDKFDIYVFVLLMLVSGGRGAQRFYLTCTDFTECHDKICNQHLLQRQENWWLTPDSNCVIPPNQVVEMKTWLFRNAVKFLVRDSKDLMGAFTPTKGHLPLEAKYLYKCKELGSERIDEWNRGNELPLRLSHNFAKNFCVVKAVAFLERDLKGIIRLVARLAALINYQKELMENPRGFKAFMERLQQNLSADVWDQPRALRIPKELRPSPELMKRLRQQQQSFYENAQPNMEQEAQPTQQHHHHHQANNHHRDVEDMNLSSSDEEEEEEDPNNGTLTARPTQSLNLTSLQQAELLSEYEEVARGASMVDINIGGEGSEGGGVDYHDDMNLSFDDDDISEAPVRKAPVIDTQVVFESEPIVVDSINKLDPLIFGRLYTFPCEFLGYVNDVDLLIRASYTSEEKYEIPDIQLWFADPGYTTEGRIIPSDKLLLVTVTREMVLQFFNVRTLAELATHSRTIDESLKEQWRPGVVGQCTVKRTEIDGVPIWLYIST